MSGHTRLLNAWPPVARVGNNSKPTAAKKGGGCFHGQPPPNRIAMNTETAMPKFVNGSAAWEPPPSADAPAGFNKPRCQSLRRSKPNDQPAQFPDNAGERLQPHFCDGQAHRDRKELGRSWRRRGRRYRCADSMKGGGSDPTTDHAPQVPISRSCQGGEAGEAPRRTGTHPSPAAINCRIVRTRQDRTTQSPRYDSARSSMPSVVRRSSLFPSWRDQRMQRQPMPRFD